MFNNQMPVTQAQPYGQPYPQQQYTSSHDREKEKKRQERLARHERKRKQEFEEGQGLVKWLSIGTLCNAGLLLVPIFGDSWAVKSFVGMGVKMLTIRTSLFMIDVKIDCGKNWLEDKLCHLGDKMHGVHTLHQGQAIMCAMTSHACSIMDRLYYGSFILFFAFSLALLCDLTAGLFLWYYWYGTPLPKIRKYSLIFFFLAPLSMLCGLFFWSCYIPNLAELPLAWTHTLTMLTGTELFAIKEVEALPYGWCWCLTWVIFLLLVAQCLAWTFCFREHASEQLAEDEEELQKLMMEDPSLFMNEDTPLTNAQPQQMQQMAAPGVQPVYGSGPPSYGAQAQPNTWGAQQQTFGLPPGVVPPMPPSGTPGQRAAW